MAAVLPEDKVMAARCRLMSTAPWYGHMSMMMEWRESTNDLCPIKTMYVTAKNGRIYCCWYRDFVNDRTVEELYGAIQHEIEHILRLHLNRSHDRGADNEIWNLAADMCVNGTVKNPRIGYSHGKDTVLPLGPDSEKHMIWIPDGWPADETTEYYYDRIAKEAQENPKGSFGKMIADMKSGEGHYTLDDHGAWAESELSPDEVRQLVSDMVREASERSQGNVPGHVLAELSRLAKPIVSWKELLKRYLGRHVGNQRKTYSRRNRRRDQFGMPGISHHAAAHVSVVVDTSGSISQDDLEQFFAEIESISSRAKVRVLQWDHSFQGFSANYRKNDWRKIEIRGRGGTDMVAPVQWLMDNKAIGDVCVMLTDGYCQYIDQQPFPMITCLCADGTEPTWGHVVHMHRKKTDN